MLPGFSWNEWYWVLVWNGANEIRQNCLRAADGTLDAASFTISSCKEFELIECEWHPETMADADDDEGIILSMFPYDDPEDIEIPDIRKGTILLRETAMILTITTTCANATDLGYLLHKNPARCQEFEMSFGKAYVFFPEATAERCTAAVMLDVDPVGMAPRHLRHRAYLK